MAGARPLIALTRPRADSAALAPEVEARGCRALIAPLLEIVAEPGPPPDLAGVQAVLLTSANAAPALARLGPGVRVFAVGEATADAARGVHAGPIESAGGDAGALAALVRERLRPAAGALLHLAGREARPEPARSLEAAGFLVRRSVVYRAEAALDLPDELGRALDERALDAVLLFSPRTARTFRDLVIKAARTAPLERVDALCISEAAAAPLAGLRLRRVAVAAAPERAALLGLLDGVPRRW